MLKTLEKSLEIWKFLKIHWKSMGRINTTPLTVLIIWLTDCSNTRTSQGLGGFRCNMHHKKDIAKSAWAHGISGSSPEFARKLPESSRPECGHFAHNQNVLNPFHNFIPTLGLPRGSTVQCYFRFDLFYCYSHIICFLLPIVLFISFVVTSFTSYDLVHNVCRYCLYDL